MKIKKLEDKIEKLSPEDLRVLSLQLLHNISQEWKARTDKIIKAMNKENRRIIKRNETLTETIRKELKKYNELVHSFNLERHNSNTLILTLKERIEKLKANEDNKE